jgi:hypothetical protein
MVNIKDETFLKFSKYGFLILIILINVPIFQNWMGSGIDGLNSIFFGIFSLLQG